MVPFPSRVVYRSPFTADPRVGSVGSHALLTTAQFRRTPLVLRPPRHLMIGNRMIGNRRPAAKEVAP
jgi:hypothetical protein